MNTILSFGLALLSSILISTPLLAQSIDFQWARSASGTGLDNCEKITVDGSGNVYVTGYYRSNTISFGSIVLTKEPGNSSSSAVFLAKYDPNGNVLWAISAGGNEEDISNGIATDANGNVCITGGFMSDSITFGPTTLYNATSNLAEDVFVAKFDTDGNLLWARSGAGAGGTPRDVGNAVTVDGSGNVYACGYFRSQSILFGSAVLSNAGQADAFIVKYDPNGNVVWARSEAGGGGDFCTGLAADASGNVYASGRYYSDFITIGSTTLTNVNNNYDLFIAKYDTDGNPLWAKGGSSNGNDWMPSLAVDANGYLIATGWFEAFPITFGPFTIPNSGSSDIFLVKYDPNGDELWAVGAGGGFAEESRAVAVDDSGNIFVTGRFGTTITLGSSTLNSSLSGNVFIAKFDPDGDPNWAVGAGGVDEEGGNGIAVGSYGDVYITGAFDSPSLPFNLDTLVNSGPDDVFIAKLGSVITGFELVRLPDDIRISPNPFTDRTTVHIHYPLIDASITIVDDLGRTMKVTRNVRGSEISIIRDDLPVGTYVIQIRDGDKYVATERILVMD